MRALAFGLLRSKAIPVKPRQLLGVIVEVPLDEGLDTLAAFADGRVRYINHSEKIAIFEGAPPQIESKVKELMQVSQGLIGRMGPWEKQRLPPPKQGNVRITFLVSDGLYFLEGSFEDILRDTDMGGPVLLKAQELFLLVVEQGTQ